jgi:hypothetical protein
MEYEVGSIPEGDLEGFKNWSERELNQIARAFKEFSMPIFAQLNNEPSRPRNGMTVYADGTNWNPGAGEGVYTYYAAAWHKLG